MRLKLRKTENRQLSGQVSACCIQFMWPYIELGMEECFKLRIKSVLFVCKRGNGMHFRSGVGM